MNFPLEPVVTKAPPGVLGAFIQRKLRQYVEPTREGTPKGEPVGLSKKKYHAAVLSHLTSLSLKRVGREVGVSYPLVRKWRTEDSFIDCAYTAAEEFADGDFDEAAKVSLRLLVRFGDTFHGGEGSEDLVKKIHEQKLFGFDDAPLYSSMLLDIIADKHTEHFRALADSLMKLKPNETLDPHTCMLASDYLGWAYSIDGIERMRTIKLDKRTQETFARRRQHAQRFLNLLIMGALGNRPVDSSRQAFACYASVVLEELLKD